MSTTPAPRPIARPVILLLWLAFVAKLGVSLWGVSRGFGLGDEGYFLLSLNAPETTPANFEFYKLLTRFDLWFDVVDVRLLRLAVEAVASALLIAGLFRFARARPWVPGASIRLREFLPFALLGFGIHAASRALSYNDVTNLCTYAATGGLLLAASRPVEGRRGRLGWAVAVGFATGLQLGVKFPAFFLLVGMVAVAILFLFQRLSIRGRIETLLATGAGALLAWGLYLVNAGGLAVLAERYREVVRIAGASGYEPLEILGLYVKGEVLTVPNALLAILLFAGLCRLLRERAGRDRAMALGAWIAMGVVAASAWLLHPFFLHPSLLWLTCFFSLALFAAVWDARVSGEERTLLADRLLLALPLALPIVNLMGSNVPFSLRLPSHALPVSAVLAAILLSTAHADRRRFRTALALLGAVVTTTVFVQHHVIAPYGLRSPLYEQTEALRGRTDVRVDFATARFLEGSADVMREAGFRPGDPIVALDYMPGLVVYLEGRSPGWPYFIFDRAELNCLILEMAELERVPFVVLGRPASPEQRACITAFDLPGDFDEVGVLRFPYEAVYEGFDAGELTHVRFLAPRPGAQIR